MAELKPLDEDELQSIVSTAVDEAVDFVETEIAPARIKAQRYYNGEVDIGHEEGRSSVVNTKVRDVVRTVKPSLMRAFMSTEYPVEYVPVGPNDVLMAEQATKYAMVKFQESGGYRLLNDVFDDALVKKQGIVKVYREEYSEAETYTFTALTAEEFQALQVDPEVEIIEQGMDPETGAVSARVVRTVTSGKLCIVSVPPEEFFIDENARSIDDCYVCGHRTEKRVGDLVAAGFDFDEVSGLGVVDSSETDEEREERQGYSADDDDSENAIDPSMELVTITEAYMRADIDGTGVPALYRFILGGAKYKLLRYEPADEIPFATFEIDPIPHTAQGRSIFDIVGTDQDAATMMLRGILDNVALVNTPRTEAVEGQVNMSDLLNNEIGGVVRVRAPGMLRDLSVPFVAGQTLPALQYLDQMVEQKTGVTRASMGLDPDALQSTTRAAVTATVSAAAAQVESMARNLAEGGMRRLFKLMLRLIVKHAKQAEMVRLNGQYVPMDPRVWDIEMDVQPNVGLGTGQEEQKLAALQMLVQFQQGVIQNYGVGNRVVSLVGLRNAMADLLALNGLRNVDRYLPIMTPQIEQQLAMAQAQAQQAAQAQQGGGDPTRGLVMAEQIKSQTKLQEASGRTQVDILKARMEDDRQRDKMAQDLFLQGAKIAADTGVRLNTEQLKAEQAAVRGPGGNVQ